MALDHDFYLTAGGSTLGFNKWITPDSPEERATAQFRKEQFDSQSTVGDQSLTGWWTRGQLSFHKGAGITYYEVLEGETVLNRFSDCDGVDVFTPGELRLTKALSDTGLSDVVDAVPAPVAAGGGVYALASDGIRYTAGVGSELIDTSNSVVPTSLASSGSLYYVTNGNLIERQYTAATARTNHIENPSFETGLTGWTGSMFADSSSPTKYGSKSIVISSSGNAAYTATGLTIGETYKFRAWCFASTGGISGVTTGGGFVIVSGATAESTAYDQWELLEATFTAAATSASISLQATPVFIGGVQYNRDIYFDAVMLTESPFTADYFDGSFPGCSWVGAPHASKSVYATGTDGSSTVRLTNSDAAWQKVWWAKGRVWAVDEENRFYALADDIATVGAVDSFWSSQKLSPRWSLTDSPGAVFISDGSDIYAVTVDTDGLVPTLTAPTTAARVPLGEEVVDIAYHLDRLVVTTTRGVRVAVVQDDRIFMGPLTIEGDFIYSGRVGFYDTTAVLAGRVSGRDGDTVLCGIDLGSPGDDVTFPWAPVFTLTDLASTATGATLDGAGRTFAWAGGSLFASSLDERQSSGSLTTGFHRFGTLDDKFFSSVTLRVRGSGAVGVYRVDEDGSETLVATVDASLGESDIALGMSVAAERIALRFALSIDMEAPDEGPTVLGYQLKALPLPKRQRMKRVPLMLFDKETNRRGQQSGKDGSAWTRLLALEALETANAVVEFEDRETGETGSAYIESVEMRRTAPTSRTADGFGGAIFLTLRVI